MSVNSSKLTSKQNNFCLYYLHSFNATKAYKQAYHVKYTTAERGGHRLMRNSKINAHLVKLREQQSDKIYCNQIDVLRELIEMFFNDVGDYVHFGNKLVRSRKTGELYHRSYLYFRNQKNLDTSLIQSITNGQNGARVVLPDKIQIASLLLKYLPAPTNHDVKDDTLVQALNDAVRRNQKHSGAQQRTSKSS